MHVIQIEFATPEYDEAVGIRYEVLRKPLGLEYTPEQLAAEYDQIHLAAYADSGRMLGYLCLQPLGADQVKMRQVAVSPQVQGKGVGRALVTYSEVVAARIGFQDMVLHAREIAVPFYLKLGYTIVGDRFEEVNIPHFKMTKSLLGAAE